MIEMQRGATVEVLDKLCAMKLAELMQMSDKEAASDKADGVLCSLLLHLGCAETVKAFKSGNWGGW